MKFEERSTWIRLIKGLTDLTTDRKIAWEEHNETVDSSLQSLRPVKTLTARNASHAYMLTGGVHGSTPLEMTITDVSGKSPKRLARFASGGKISSSSQFVIAHHVGELFRAAERSITEPDDLVDELLAEWADDSEE